jgi:hypothetical protein
MNFWAWLDRNSAPLGVVLQFLQALGIGVAVFVLLLTQAQIKDTRNALRASTELQIQKEGRDIWGSASEPQNPTCTLSIRT